MAKPTHIAHPLKNRRGTSQRTRRIDALKPETALIDGRDLADMLSLISQYALQINFYEYVKNTKKQDSQELHSWSVFFSNSLPFQLASLSKLNTSELEEQYLLLYNELVANPSKHALDALLNFFIDQLILPVSLLFNRVSAVKNSFMVSMRSIVESSFKEPLKCYMAISNASATFLCTCKQNFAEYLQDPWRIEVKDIYALDSCIQQTRKGKKAAFLIVANTLGDLFYKMLNALNEIVETAPDYIHESLWPLEEEFQQKHQPHLALLFTFLELFKHFQGNLNSLTKEHLDFFYKEVLKMVPKKEIADRAHIVFEIAKHLGAYQLPEGLLLKNGKDANSEDIQFGLDHEIVIDKAQIKDIKTLMLNKTNINDECYLEGVYMAPKANSKDGLGMEFKDEDDKNWYTLGAKESKNISEEPMMVNEHPSARLGFILSSPVLLLQEGKRTIEIRLQGRVSLNEYCKGEKQSVKDCFMEFKNDFNSGTKTQYVFQTNVLNTISLKLSDNAFKYVKKVPLIEEKLVLTKVDLNRWFNTKDAVTCENIFLDEDIKLLETLLVATDLLKDKNLETISDAELNAILNDPEIHSCLLQKNIPIDTNLLEYIPMVVDIPLFHVYLSGEEEWLTCAPKIDMNVAPFANHIELTFNIIITLEADVPPVTFYSEEVFEEKLDIKQAFPSVKFELNPNYKTRCHPNSGKEKYCCLEIKKKERSFFNVSTYQFLQKMQLTNAEIEVNVCGVKNLVVQNDENIQDVNKPILPFGARPKVGAGGNIDGGSNFYIGSKEIFCKNWKKFWINTEWKDKPLNFKQHYRYYDIEPFEDGSLEIDNQSFKLHASVLEIGLWQKDFKVIPNNPDKTFVLFGYHNESGNSCSKTANTYCHGFEKEAVPNANYVPKTMTNEPLAPLNIHSRKGFLKLTLAGVGFQHDRYTFALARQMMEMADLFDPISVNRVQEDLRLSEILGNEAKTKIGAINVQLGFLITHAGQALGHTTTILAIAQTLRDDIEFVQLNPGHPTVGQRIDDAKDKIDDLIDTIGAISTTNTLLHELDHIIDDADNINDLLDVAGGTDPISNVDIDNNISSFGLLRIIHEISRRIESIKDILKINEDLGIPKEPYTPTIKSLSIDYNAVASIHDIDIIHLYPYKKTSRFEYIEQKPTLLPFFNDEGSLFLGLENLSPGGQLSLLFQLAETTADSETNRADIRWQYLSKNTWNDLRTGFEVISDDTDGLTVSGIVTIAVPDDITDTDNTIMPEGLYWIKVYAPENIKAVAQTLGIHTQAALSSARISILNSKDRLEEKLPEGSISKLVSGDFSIKKIEQPYASFGGRKPEESGHFYIRVSEHLKHKGRALTSTDYEKIVLEHFPEIYKVKSISHSMGLSAHKYERDLEVAPGFTIITVIPDLTKLGGGSQLEPKVPVSLLEKITKELKKRTSPFARFKVMNPRYEYIDVTIKVRLYRGKPINFYRKKLMEDITFFLAPWYLGDSEKLSFGQEVFFSDVVGFVESLDYVDFITDLQLSMKLSGEDCDDQTGSIIKPLTARSILTGGEICVTIDEEDCPELENSVTEEKEKPVIQ